MKYRNEKWSKEAAFRLAKKISCRDMQLKVLPIKPGVLVGKTKQNDEDIEKQARMMEM
jgi:hypothetical protein